MGTPMKLANLEDGEQAGVFALRSQLRAADPASTVTAESIVEALPAVALYHLGVADPATWPNGYPRWGDIARALCGLPIAQRRMFERAPALASPLTVTPGAVDDDDLPTADDQGDDSDADPDDDEGWEAGADGAHQGDGTPRADGDPPPFPLINPATVMFDPSRLTATDDPAADGIPPAMETWSKRHRKAAANG